MIHHTATDNVRTKDNKRLGKKAGDTYTAEDMKQSMINYWIKNRGGTIVPTHYIIDKDGGIVKVNEWGHAVGACAKDNYNTREQVADCNFHGIHVELVGNFDEHEPTETQYQALNQLITDIQKKAQNEYKTTLDIKGHKDFQTKTCPGVNFDFSKINTGESSPVVSAPLPPQNQAPIAPKKQYQEGDVIFFNEITGYYNCEQGQERYFKNRTYEEEKKINGCGAFAAGWYGLPDHAMTHGACGRGRPFGTIFEIEGFGQVTCVDRGSAIDDNDFDIWYGIGYSALQELEKYNRPNQANVKIIYLPK